MISKGIPSPNDFSIFYALHCCYIQLCACIVTARKVERHVRRLAAPLLLRAGERVRLHSEAPATVRLGVRRASKGYGPRVTRQCAISSGVAAAWGAAGDDMVAAAAAEAGGLPATWKVAGAAAARAMPSGSVQTQENWTEAVSGSANCNRGAAENRDAHCDTGRARSSDPAMAGSQASRGGMNSPCTPQQRARQRDMAEEALTEVVRLSMGMFDKICPPEERLDITLLSVGFAGFRDMGGGAQTGITRYDGISRLLQRFVGHVFDSARVRRI